MTKPMLEKPLLASHRCRIRLNPQTYQILYRSHMGGDRWISDTPFGISNKKTRCHCHYQSSSHRISQKYSDALYRPWKDPGFCERWLVHLVRPERELPARICKGEIFGDNLTCTLLSFMSYIGDAVYPNARNSLPRRVAMFSSYWVVKNIATVSRG